MGHRSVESERKLSIVKVEVKVIGEKFGRMEKNPVG
jgi:hypothetical protein